MIKIIGVHPAVFSNPDGVREYIKDFGTDKGRWIPLVPTNWKSVVSQALKQCGLGPVKSNELRDRIKNPSFADRYVKIDDPDLTEGSWNEVIVRLLERGLCDAVIVPPGEDFGSKTLVAHQFDPDCDLYAVNTSGFLERNPHELAKKIVPALRFSNEIHVIDVYCHSAGTNSASYGRFFGDLLNWCRANNPGVKLITLHRRLPNDFDQNREESNYATWIKPILVTGETFCVRYLRERPHGDRIHLRAVFSDKVLITGHYGFGEGPSEIVTTDLILRKHGDLIELKNLYLSDDKMGFDLVNTIEVTP